MGTPLITKAFLLIAISKKAAHFLLFVKYFLKIVTKNWAPHFCDDPAFLNLVTLARRPSPTELFGKEGLGAVGVGEQGFGQCGQRGGAGFGGVGFGAVAEGFAELGVAVVDSYIDNSAKLGG